MFRAGLSQTLETADLGMVANQPHIARKDRVTEFNRTR